MQEFFYKHILEIFQYMGEPLGASLGLLFLQRSCFMSLTLRPLEAHLLPGMRIISGQRRPSGMLPCLPLDDLRC